VGFLKICFYVILAIRRFKTYFNMLLKKKITIIPILDDWHGNLEDSTPSWNETSWHLLQKDEKNEV